MKIIMCFLFLITSFSAFGKDKLICKDAGGRMYRCENSEVICYKDYGTDGFQCKFKEKK